MTAAVKGLASRTIHRESVELLLKMLDHANDDGHSMPVAMPFLAALCRRWLVVEDAPVGVYEGLDAEAALIRFDDIDAPGYSDWRVRIVPERWEDGRG